MSSVNIKYNTLLPIFDGYTSQYQQRKNLTFDNTKHCSLFALLRNRSSYLFVEEIFSSNKIVLLDIPSCFQFIDHHLLTWQCILNISDHPSLEIRDRDSRLTFQYSTRFLFLAQLFQGLFGKTRFLEIYLNKYLTYISVQFSSLRGSKWL